MDCTDFDQISLKCSLQWTENRIGFYLYQKNDGSWIIGKKTQLIGLSVVNNDAVKKKKNQLILSKH